MIRKELNYLRSLVLTLLFVLTLFSCKQQDSEVEALKHEVLNMHDNVMPRIGTLINLKKQLNEKAAKLDTAKEDNKGKLTALQLAIKELEQVDEAMMQWMRTYEDPNLADGQNKAVEYLKVKKKEIVQVKERLELSEIAAKSLL